MNRITQVAILSVTFVSSFTNLAHAWDSQDDCRRHYEDVINGALQEIANREKSMGEKQGAIRENSQNLIAANQALRGAQRSIQELRLKLKEEQQRSVELKSIVLGGGFSSAPIIEASQDLQATFADSSHPSSHPSIDEIIRENDERLLSGSPNEKQKAALLAPVLEVLRTGFERDVRDLLSSEKGRLLLNWLSPVEASLLLTAIQKGSDAQSVGTSIARLQTVGLRNSTKYSDQLSDRERSLSDQQEAIYAYEERLESLFQEIHGYQQENDKRANVDLPRYRLARRCCDKGDYGKLFDLGSSGGDPMMLKILADPAAAERDCQ